MPTTADQKPLHSRISRTFAAIALTLPLLFAVSATAEATVDISCSVQRTSGGLLLRWSAVPNATQYQYKLSVPGEGNRYRRVSGTEVLIPLDAGKKGSLSIAPIFSDGSTQRRVKCGSQTASAFTCSVTGTRNGVNLSWSAVDGATSYRYRLTSQGRNSFGTVSGTSTFISTDIRTKIEIGLTAVMADGSVGARTNCGMSASTTPPNVAVRTCSIESADGGVKVSWNTVGAAARYQYKAQIDGRNRYRRVEGTSTFIEAAAGTSVTVGVSPIFNDGSTVRRVNCGTAVAG